MLQAFAGRFIGGVDGILPQGSWMSAGLLNNGVVDVTGRLGNFLWNSAGSGGGLADDHDS